MAVMEARLGKGGSSSNSGTGSVCTSTCTSFAVLGSGRWLGPGDRVGRRMPLEKRWSADERSEMEVGMEMEEEEGQKENSWEEAELAELRRGEMAVSSSNSCFAIVRKFRVWVEAREREMEREREWVCLLVER